MSLSLMVDVKINQIRPKLKWGCSLSVEEQALRKVLPIAQCSRVERIYALENKTTEIFNIMFQFL